MQYENLTFLKKKISLIGFGGWGIGGATEGNTSYGQTSDKVSLNAISLAFEKGINFFDTSPAYGNGKSESLIGNASQKFRDEIIIATKAGIVEWNKAADYSPFSIKKSLEGSLKRIKSPYIDILQLHNPSIDLLFRDNELVDCLEQLKSNGKIRSWGVSVKNPEEGIQIAKKLPLDFIQTNLNLLDIRAITSGLVDIATLQDVKLIARTPLCFGFLTGEVNETTKFPEGDHRLNWSTEQKRKWIQGAALMQKELSVYTKSSITTLALRFCHSVQGVVTCIPGMMTPREVEINCSDGAFDPLSPIALQKVLDINEEQNFFVS